MAASAAPRATVSAPLRWDEVADVHPNDFDVTTMPARFAEVGDLFAALVGHVEPRGSIASLLELACRGYLHEPEAVDEHSWPTPLDPDHAAPLRATLQQVLDACLDFATSRSAA